MVGDEVMRDPEVSLRAKGLYSYLSIFSDKTTNELFVGITKMAAETGLSHSTIKRLLEELQEKRIIYRYSKGKGLTKVTVLLK